jgi:hypothetical protein
MNALKTLRRIFLGWLVLLAAQMVAGIIAPVKAPALPLPHTLEWWIATDFVIAVTLGFVATKSNLTGWKLAAILALVPFAIGVTNIIEGAVFLKSSQIAWKSLFFYDCIAYVLVLPLWRYVFGGRAAHPAPDDQLSLNAGKLAWKLVVSDLLYVTLYYTAGTIIFPFVRDFYATHILPSTGTIVALQLLIRGPLFIGVCLLLTRLIELPRWAGAIAVGLAFAVLSGIVPLLMPNPYLPDSVRWVHMAEVSTSNFVFGACVRLIWSEQTETSAPSALQHTV